MPDLFRRGTVAAALCLAALMIGPFQGLEGEVGVSDKLAHAAAFAVITATVFLNWRAGSRVQIAGIVLLVGIGVEIIQGVTGRDMEMGDIIADAVGILLVAAFWPQRRAF